MIENIAPLLHYGSVFFIIGLTTVGIGIGGGKASRKALEALNIAPTTYNAIARTVLVGLALIETSAILGIVMALMIILGQQEITMATSLAHWGIAFALGLSGAIVGILSALPTQEASFAIARQPFFAAKILNTMLITLSIVQTPIIFSFLISLFIKSQVTSTMSIGDGVRLLASGLCIGIGAIGPTIGLARFAGVANKSIAFNRNAYGVLMPFTFISQAIIETPIIFAVLISILLLVTPLTQNFLAPIACLAAALCAGLGTLGPGIGSGKIASTACLEIAHNPEKSSLLSRTSILGQGVIDAAAMYALLVALIIIVLR